MNTLTGFLLVPAFLLAGGGRVLAQSGDNYLRQIATPQEVIVQITGDDEFVVEAKRFTVMRAIQDAIGDHKRLQGRKELTPAERALFMAHKNVSGQIRDKYDARTQELDKEYYKKWRQTAFDFTKNPMDRLEVLRKFAPPLATALSAQIHGEAAQWNSRQTKRDRKHFYQFATGMAGFLIVLSFLMLSLSAWLDRRRKNGADVQIESDSVNVSCYAAKIGPGTAVTFYPFLFNVLLFLITLAVPLSLVIAFAPDGMIAWLDRYVPIPKSLTLNKVVTGLILFGFMLLTFPWVSLVFANLCRRRKQSFTITQEGILVGGKRYEPSKIRRIFYRGTIKGDPDEEAHEPFHFQGNAAARAAESGRLFGRAIAKSWQRMQRSLGRVRYQVCLEHDGKPRVIAKGLSLDRAERVWAGAQFATEKFNYSCSKQESLAGT